MSNKREPYKPEDKLLKSPTLAKMRLIAYDPKPARMILNRLDKLHDDNAAEEAAMLKRARKAQKRIKNAQRHG